MRANELSPITFRLSDAELNLLYTSEYWNDIEAEKRKVWWIQDGAYEPLLAYLKSSKLYDDYLIAEKKLKDLYSGRAVIVADLAAGIGWVSALLSKVEVVKEVYCTEISMHRIDILCPSAIKMFEGEASKIKRYISSFYSTGFLDSSVDVVFLMQAFHHAAKPFDLLKEVNRILKNDGIVLIVGEPYIGWVRIIRRFFSLLIKQGKVVTNFYEMFPPDPILGDHYYRNSDYFFIANSLGMSCRVEKLPSGSVMYTMTKGKN